MTTEATRIEALEPTIDLQTLSFADWIGIAQSFNQDEKWAYFRWRDTVNPNTLQKLTLTEWEGIAEKIGWSGSWAYKQLKEYQSRS